MSSNLRSRYIGKRGSCHLIGDPELLQLLFGISNMGKLWRCVSNPWNRLLGKGERLISSPSQKLGKFCAKMPQCYSYFVGIRYTVPLRKHHTLYSQ